MKRKIFSKLLMGAFLIASISSFVSCKDYDDDIKKNTDAIGALQTTVNNLQQALDAAKAEANTAHAAFALKTQVASDIAAATKGLATEDAVAQVKKANEDAVAALAAEIKALATIDALEAAKKEAADALAKAMEGTATKEDLDKVSVAVSAIDSKLDGINTALAETNNNVKANADAIAAAQKNIETQQAAIAALQEALKGAGSSSAIDDLKGEVGKANQEISSVKGELAKAQADLAALRTALNSKGNQAAIDALDAKVKELEGLKTELAELKSAVTKLQDLSEVKDLMKKADEKVDKVSTNINLLTVFVTKQLRSIVFQPNFYLGGIEAAEVPAIVYQPIEQTNTNDFTYKKIDGKSYGVKGIGVRAGAWNTPHIKTFTDHDIAWFKANPAKVITTTPAATAATEVVVLTPNAQMSYHMNPSNVGKDNITGVSVISDDKAYITRAAASAPAVKAWDVANGMLNTEVALTYKKIANTANQVTVMATQVQYKGVQGDTVITSDYHAVAPSVYGDLVIADKGAKEGEANCNIKDYKAKHPYVKPSDAITATIANLNTATFTPRAAAHQIAWNHNGVDLSTIFEVHGYHKVFNAGGVVNADGAAGGATGTGFKEYVITPAQLKQWGLELRYSLVEYTTGTEFTEQTLTHSQLDGSVFKPYGINESQTNASIGRMPLIRIDLVDTNNGDQLVKRGYSKFEIVADKPADVNIPVAEGTRYWNCKDIERTLTWEEVESKVLDNNEVKTNGIAKTTFELLYAVDGGTGKNIATETANPINATTYIKWNGKWAKASSYKIYSGSGMNMNGAAIPVADVMSNTIIDYIFNTTGSNRTGQIAFKLTPTQVRMILAKHNAKGDKYLDQWGNETVNLMQADLEDTKDFEIATRLYDVAQGGQPDLYISFKYTISKLTLTMNKIADYWYASNSTVAKSGVDEIHISVPVIGETGADVKNFNSEFLNTIVTNRLQIAAKNNSGVECGYTVANLADDQRAQMATNKNTGTAAYTTPIETEMGFYTAESTTIGSNVAAHGNVPAMAWNNAGEVMVGYSGTKYLLVATAAADGTPLLVASKYQSTPKNYADAGSKEVVKLTSNKKTSWKFEVVDNDYAKDLVNAASHTELAKSLTAHVWVRPYLACDANIPVVLTNNVFDVKFLRPVDIQGVDAKIFKDATDGGNVLDLINLIKFNDWRERWNPGFGTSEADLFNTRTDATGKTVPDYTSPKWGKITNNYFQYYRVTEIKADIDNITTDMNNGTLGKTKLATVTSSAQFSNVTSSGENIAAKYYGYKNANVAGTGTWSTDITPNSFSGNIYRLRYENNQMTVGTFKVRVPLKVTYYWGTMKVDVDITVDNTIQN